MKLHRTAIVLGPAGILLAVTATMSGQRSSSETAKPFPALVPLQKPADRTLTPTTPMTGIRS